MDPTYPLVPVLNLIASVLSAVTIASGIGPNYNIGVLMLSTWLLFLTLIQGIETIVWSGTSDNKAPAWCDICTYTANVAAALL